MKIIEQHGKTVEEAIKEGLKKMGVSRELVNIEVICKGRKGILGFGAIPAQVRLSLIQNPTQIAIHVTNEILRLMKVKGNITLSKKNEKSRLEIYTSESQYLIGKNGQIIDALQYLVNIIVRKTCGNKKEDIILDIDRYRARKEDEIVQLAIQAATQVTKTKKDVILEPMNPYERQIVHMTLQNHRKVATKSIGEGNERRVVVFLKSKSDQQFHHEKKRYIRKK